MCLCHFYTRAGAKNQMYTHRGVSEKKITWAHEFYFFIILQCVKYFLWIIISRGVSVLYNWMYQLVKIRALIKLNPSVYMNEATTRYTGTQHAWAIWIYLHLSANIYLVYIETYIHLCCTLNYFNGNNDSHERVCRGAVR